MRKLITIGALTAGVIAAAAFAAPSHHRGPAVRGTPAAHLSGPIERVPRAELLKYAHSLVFDTSYDASDETRIMARVGDKIEVGALVRLSPEIGIRAVEGLGRGHIYVRIWAEAPDVRQGLARGLNYVWMDSTNGRMRAVIIPEDPAAPLVITAAAIRHKVSPSHAVETRLRWDEATGRDGIWVPCGEACCHAS